ncbi:MAG TPA: FAD-dependent oxidoreductase [Acidimicrobiia bacterium]|nr:FAD-dependent oxidoreductase [Acidimicrobiia bacterium]
MSQDPVVVVGAGVSGLSCAIRLIEMGMAVRVVAAHPTEQTTSAAAGAMWYPYLAAPQHLVLGWAQTTRIALDKLAAEDPATGVRRQRFIEFHEGLVADPWWAPAVPGLRYARPDELRTGFGHGWVFEVPMVRTPVYLGWLQQRLAELGGTIELLDQPLDRLPEATVVVNCGGWEAGRLAGDDATVIPTSGQVVVVANPGVEVGLMVEHGPGAPLYIIPRGEDCVLGGTANPSVLPGTPPDDEVTAQIIDKCARLEPALRDAAVLDVKIGFRPVRERVRVESVTRDDGSTVVHNYGHGGAGYTLSWGCAEAAASLVEEAITRRG